MKFRSLIAGTLLLSGAGAAYAADAQPPVVAAIDVCDAIGLSGLTIGSSDTCLQISGFVKYEFRWGDFANQRYADNFTDGAVNFINPRDDSDHNSTSVADWWVQMDARSETDFGTARAVLRLDDRVPTESNPSNIQFTRAYVQVGDGTVLTAGLTTSVFDTGDSRVYNGLLGLFSNTNTGGPSTSGASHVIQISHPLVDGVTLSAGLENLNGSAPRLVGVGKFRGDWGSGHISVAANEAGDWKQHSSGQFSFGDADLTTVFASDHTGFWNALLSGQYDFDMFSISGGVQYAEGGEYDPQWGAGAQISTEVADSIRLNLGSRYLTNTVTGEDIWQVALGADTDITDNITLQSRIGYVASTYTTAGDDFGYMDVRLRYQPGSRVVAVTGFEANTTGAYRVSFDLERGF